jgi:flagellar biosynthetic protein FliQ
VSSAQAVELIAGLLRVTMTVAGPVLLGSLCAGLLVGILQAATQVNEASVSFIAKMTMVVVVLVGLGPTLVTYAVDYARNSLLSIEHVVR